MARSEANKVGNPIYSDLPMTSYPAYKDAGATNETTKDKLNPNMKGWINVGDGIPDYVMAEHVNALIDSVRALQRAVGIEPMVPYDVTGLTAEQISAIKQTKTVKTRMDDLERRNYDERYGGPGWTPTTDRTLASHYHTGEVGRPSKIQLTNSGEVQGKLEKVNLNLNASTGVTGSDLALSTGNTMKISDALGDKLSVTDGGTVSGKVIFKNAVDTLTTKEYRTSDFSGNAVVDTQTYSGSRKESSPTAKTTLLNATLRDLQYGKYILGVRAKLVSGNVDVTTLLKLTVAAQTEDALDTTDVIGADFDALNKWQMFYLVFDHEPATTGKTGQLLIEKMATTVSNVIAIDHAYIVPAHPAVFDR